MNKQVVFSKGDIVLPVQFPLIRDEGASGYLIHFEREKKNKACTPHLYCQPDRMIICQSHEKCVAVPDGVILRLATG